jgi:hypothetical protein
MAVLVGLILGVAQLTKFTLLLLYVAWPIVGVIYVWECGRVKLQRYRILAQSVLILLLSLGVINLGYLFKDSGRRLGSLAFVSRAFGGEPPAGQPSFANALWGNRFRDSWLGAIPVPLPADYVLGVDQQRRDFEELAKEIPSYLAGEWRTDGWLHYYLYALAVKVPIGIIALVAWAIGLTLMQLKKRSVRADEAAFWIPVLSILTFVSLQTGMNHHMRYILPIFPFVAVSTSKLGTYLKDFSFRALLVLTLAGWAVASSLWVWPHQLSYFNELAGGPSGGHKHLLGSNIDWGQDLLYLRSWLDDHPEARPLDLAYYNSLDAGIVGLEYELPPPAPDSLFRDDALYAQSLGPHPGYYAISVNFLRGMPGRAFDGHGGERVIPLHEYEYFLNFQPIAMAGYSMYIYSISLDEANHVRRQLGLPELK